MSRVRVLGFSMSLDGYGAGPNQSLHHPLGVGGHGMAGWLTGTRTFPTMVLNDPTKGSTGPDNDFAAKSFENIGAWIMGRNMFAPSRGPWADEAWKGWWGDDPPYHTPVFVLTHHPREPLVKQGGTTFHFVTDGIESALEQARAAAGGKDVAVAGGASAVRQYLSAGVLDELQLHVVPVLLGDGERLFDDVGGAALGLECVETVAAPGVTHLTYRITRP